MDSNDGDDLYYCLDHNTPLNFKEEDITHIVAEVPGHNDEATWWWVLRLSGGKHVLLSAGCDYTGWDCRSGIDFEQITNSALQAAKLAPISEDFSGREIRINLIRQIQGKQPFGVEIINRE